MSENYLKYPRQVITGIAQELDMGMICFLNTDTLEFEAVWGESDEEYEIGDVDDLYREVYDKVESWEHSIRIEPPEARQSFEMMERFIENCIPPGDARKNCLREAISRRKPFRNFKFLMDNSPYRQNWFDFKQAQLEQLVLEQLLDKENKDGNSVERM